MLQRLSSHTESNFISTKVFIDNASGRLRARTMEGIHYSDFGVRLLAKEIKKSLYSNANQHSTRLTRLCTLSDTQQHHGAESTAVSAAVTSNSVDDDAFSEVDDDVFDAFFDDHQLSLPLDEDDQAHSLTNTMESPDAQPFDWLH